MDQERFRAFQKTIEELGQKMQEQIRRLAAATNDPEVYWKTGDNIRAELREYRAMLDAVELSLFTEGPTRRDEPCYKGLQALASPDGSDALESMEAVMDKVCSCGDYTALKEVRARYEREFGVEQCWSYPFCDGEHLGCVFLPVQEGVLYLPYDEMDNETYEQFAVRDACLLDREKAQSLLSQLETRSSDLRIALGLALQAISKCGENGMYMPIQYTIRGITLSRSELGQIDQYYEAACTARYLLRKFEQVKTQQQALELGYEVRRQMRKYDYTEDEAIAEVLDNMDDEGKDDENEEDG